MKAELAGVALSGPNRYCLRKTRGGEPQNCNVNSRMDRLAWMQQPKSGSIEVGIGIMSESLTDTAALTAPERDNMHFILSSYRMRAATCNTPECIIAVAAQVQPYAKRVFPDNVFIEISKVLLLNTADHKLLPHNS